ncbi:MAG: ribulose-phosphate 3-epimerase [Clostridiales bacterium]|nr:ribulose-phosphate 3-epimerase [Clostridiales bacterium]
MAQLAPSILTADLTNLRAELARLEEGGADLVHLDVMDGSFVPNITFGQPVVRSIAKATKLPLDIHLMIVRPELCLEEFVTERTEYISVHAEACLHLHRTIQQIKSIGVKAGVSLNPATPLSAIEYVIGELDMVLIMSVNPGFGGQKFIESTWEKLRALDAMRKEKNPKLLIEIDGGVNLDNAAQLAAAGADILVAGSAVFSGGDAAENVRKFREILKV